MMPETPEQHLWFEAGYAAALEAAKKVKKDLKAAVELGLMSEEERKNIERTYDS